MLLHPPAIFDFRVRPAFLGPLADAVPSTAMFEMYPVGLTSIAAFLERNHYNVEIINLAYRMVRDPQLDVEQYLRGLPHRYSASTSTGRRTSRARSRSSSS